MRPYLVCNKGCSIWTTHVWSLMASIAQRLVCLVRGSVAWNVVTFCPVNTRFVLLHICNPMFIHFVLAFRCNRRVANFRTLVLSYSQNLKSTCRWTLFQKELFSKPTGAAEVSLSLETLWPRWSNFRLSSGDKQWVCNNLLLKQCMNLSGQSGQLECQRRRQSSNQVASADRKRRYTNLLISG